MSSYDKEYVKNKHSIAGTKAACKKLGYSFDENGNMITNELIISADYSSGYDFSVVTLKCSNCRTIIDFIPFEPIVDRNIIRPLFKENPKTCPSCGVEFKTRIEL